MSDKADHILTRLGYSGAESGGRYRYVCFCGKVGQWLDSQKLARIAHKEHRFDQVGPVTVAKKIELTWKQITLNCWVAYLPGGLSLAVNRNRSWKTQNDAKPFKVTVFGNIYAHPHGFEFLDEAQMGAERIARQVILDLTGWATGTAVLRG